MHMLTFNFAETFYDLYIVFFQTRLLTVHISEAGLLSHMFILDRCNVQPCWCRLCILHYGKKEAFILTTLLIKNQCRQRQRIDHKGHKYY